MAQLSVPYDSTLASLSFVLLCFFLGQVPHPFTDVTIRARDRSKKIQRRNNEVWQVWAKLDMPAAHYSAGRMSVACRSSPLKAPRASDKVLQPPMLCFLG